MVRVSINLDLTLLVVGKTAKVLLHTMDNSRHFGMSSLPIFFFEGVTVEVAIVLGLEILAKNVKMNKSTSS